MIVEIFAISLPYVKKSHFTIWGLYLMISL